MITTYDLGGHNSARRLWGEYFGSADGVVYIVDAADSIRFAEAKKELAQLLECEELQVRIWFEPCRWPVSIDINIMVCTFWRYRIFRS